MKKYFKYTKIIYILLILNSLVSFAQLKTAQVVAIKDGDTVVLLDDNNNQITIRLAEVDCPEKKQAFGTRAKQFTSEQVYLEYVQYTITSKDRYGRSIGKIYYDDNKYLSEEIIKAGYGWHYSQYSKSQKLSEIQADAKAHKRGLWVDENPIATWEFRKQKIKK